MTEDLELKQHKNKVLVDRGGEGVWGESSKHILQLHVVDEITDEDGINDPREQFF